MKKGRKTLKITIITACYNSAATLVTAITSVLSQTYQDIEHIVVDGGSTDGTVDLLRNLAEEVGFSVHLNPEPCTLTPKHLVGMRWISEPDKGMYDAINKGIRMATGDVIGILNADDFLADDRVIERIAEEFQSAKTDVVYGDVRFVREARRDNLFFAKNANGVKDGMPTQSANTPSAQLVLHPESSERNVDLRHGAEETKSLYPVLLSAVFSGLRRETDADFNSDLCEKDSISPESSIRFEAGRALEDLRSAKTLRYYSAKRWRPWMLQWGYMPPHPGVYIRRDCFERLGNYKFGYHIAADYELLIRFLRRGGLTMRYLDACIVGMRPGGKSTKSWRSNVLLNQEIVRGNRENGYFCCLPMLVPKYVFKVFEFVIPWMKNKGSEVLKG